MDENNFILKGTPIVIDYQSILQFGLDVGVITKHYDNDCVYIEYIERDSYPPNYLFEGTVNNTYVNHEIGWATMEVYPAKANKPVWVLCYPFDYQIRSLLCPIKEFNERNPLTIQDLN